MTTRYAQFDDAAKTVVQTWLRSLQNPDNYYYGTAKTSDALWKDYYSGLLEADLDYLPMPD